jgi:GT2 family glycosyltransferase
MGIPAAFNLGCNWAATRGTDFVFLCQGASVVETDTLSRLVRTAQRDPEAGILTPKIMSHEKPGAIWSIGSRFRKFPPSVKSIGMGREDDGSFTESREVEFAVSSGLLVRREVLERAGLFDPGYQFYYEDVDFSQRAREEGFRIRFVPEARMVHKESGEPQRSAAFYRTWGESFTRYYRRHMTPMALKLPLHLAYLTLRETTTGNASNVPALLKGAFAGLHQRMGDIPRLDSDFIEMQ